MDGDGLLSAGTYSVSSAVNGGTANPILNQVVIPLILAVLVPFLKKLGNILIERIKARKVNKNG